MIRLKVISKEVGRTVRAAMQGTPQTVRLIFILVALALLLRLTIVPLLPA